MPASGEHPRIKSSTLSFLPAGCEPSDAEADAIFSVGMAKPAETLFESLASPEEGATRPAPRAEVDGGEDGERYDREDVREVGGERFDTVVRCASRAPRAHPVSRKT